MSRRDAIKMSAEEAEAFLAEQKTLTCATNGRDGFPHLMPLWFVVREVLREAGDAAVLEPPDARDAIRAAAERLQAVRT